MVTIYSHDTGEDTGSGRQMVAITAQFKDQNLIIEELIEGNTWDTSTHTHASCLDIDGVNTDQLLIVMGASDREDLLKKICTRFTGSCFNEIKKFLKANQIQSYFTEQW